LVGLYSKAFLIQHSGSGGASGTYALQKNLANASRNFTSLGK